MRSKMRCGGGGCKLLSQLKFIARKTAHSCGYLTRARFWYWLVNSSEAYSLNLLHRQFSKRGITRKQLLIKEKAVVLATDEYLPHLEGQARSEFYGIQDRGYREYIRKSKKKRDHMRIF